MAGYTGRQGSFSRDFTHPHTCSLRKGVDTTAREAIFSHDSTSNPSATVVYVIAQYGVLTALLALLFRFLFFRFFFFLSFLFSFSFFFFPFFFFLFLLFSFVFLSFAGAEYGSLRSVAGWLVGGL